MFVIKTTSDNYTRKRIKTLVFIGNHKAMSAKKIILLISIISITGCRLEKEYLTTNKYLRWVDDIEFDPLLDNKNFKLCHGEDSVFQYFNNSAGLEYSGEKIAIDKLFQEKYNPNKVTKESGLIRIRFIVNCQGETDRFRIISMDEAYEEKKFDGSITNQLLEITRSLKGWKQKELQGKSVDYYQYLIFKIHQGRIVKISP